MLGVDSKMAAQQDASDMDQGQSNFDFTTYTVPLLKEHLQERGITCSDYRKEVLVELCEKSRQLNLPVVKTDDSYKQATLDRQTVIVHGKSVKLDLGAVNEWSEDLKTLPNFDWPQIIVYLMQTCGWTVSHISTLEQSRAFYLKDSNHIDKVNITHWRIGLTGDRPEGGEIQLTD